MTFYEAALRVLEGAGQPLTFQEITERSIAGNLLSHVGKTPEETMLSRLLAMARRPSDRRVVVTAKDTFGLIEWPFPEDEAALAETAAQQENPEDALPPYRPVERHPEPRSENVRASGRGGSGKRSRDEDGSRKKKTRFPPVSEAMFEVLTEAGEPLPPPELGERAHGKGLTSDLSTEQILLALIEDNQRRIDAGRRPQFILRDGELSLERGGSDIPPVEIQTAFAQALGIPMENGRPALPRSGGKAAESTLDPLAYGSAKTVARDAKRAFAKALRDRLAELDPGTLEKSVLRMLQSLGFRELKVAKRSKEGPMVTARKREGSLELRYAVRILRSGGNVERRSIQDVRRDLNHFSAQVGIVISTGELRGDARSEATHGALVLPWCGEGLADKFIEAKVGVKVTTIEFFETDERFFDEARVDAEESQKRRDERKGQRQRDEREDASLSSRSADGDEREESQDEGESRSISAPREKSVSAKEARSSKGSEDESDAGEEGDDSADGQEEGGEAGSGSGRRRRRRRRGRKTKTAGSGEGTEADGAAAAGESSPESASGDAGSGETRAAAGESSGAGEAHVPGNVESVAGSGDE